MFNFNLKGTTIYLAVKWEKLPPFRFAKTLKKIFLFLFFFVLLAFIYGFFLEKFSTQLSKALLGFSIILIAVSIFFWIVEKFVNSRLKKPKLKISLQEAAANPEQYNIAELLSFEIARAVKKSLSVAGSSGVTSNHLFYFLLIDNPKLNFIFSRALLNIEEIEKKLLQEIKKLPPAGGSDVFTDIFQETILEALKIASGKKHSRIEIGDVIAALADKDPVLNEILILSKLKSEDIKNLAWLLENIEERIEKRKKFWEYENLAKRGTLAKEWTAGYTLTLDRYSIDITDRAKRAPSEFISHNKEKEIIERVLSRRELNNALIVGEPGSGRKSIIEGLAQRSLLGKSLPEVNYKRIVQLDVNALLAQIENTEEVEATLDKIFEEAVLAGNIILVIDEFHNYIGQVSRPGVVDISGIIVPYLRLPHFQIIAITTYDGLHRYIEKNPSVLSLFEKIEVTEVSAEETLLILETLIPVLEQKYKIFISYPAIRDIISLSERYLPALSFPEKAIELLDSVAIFVASLAKEKVVLPSHVAKVITEKADIPVGEIQIKEKEVLLNLEDLIHQRIINQNEAVNEIATALRRARADITIRKGPMGAFLFLGPTGVGKTETSKALAEFYFGSEERMIRMDMSEFQQIKDISRLIGSAEEIGLLTSQVRETPFSLVLLDEFEKAHPNILNLFLQVFDEGYITDGMGNKIDFKNTIIIATSNAAYQIILQVLKELTGGGPFLVEKPISKSQEVWNVVKKRVLDYIFEKGIFRPELVNRFDAMVVFRPLTKENLLAITELLLQKLKKNLKEKGIEFLITEELKEKIVELGYNPVFGAREMRRVIQEKVENILASALLSNELVRGNTVGIDAKNFKLVINPKT